MKKIISSVFWVFFGEFKKIQFFSVSFQDTEFAGVNTNLKHDNVSGSIPHRILAIKDGRHKI